MPAASTPDSDAVVLFMISLPPFLVLTIASQGRKGAKASSLAVAFR
jgi:hypothetical protein